MFRSERFTLTDAVFLALGTLLCVLLVLVLVQMSRQRSDREAIQRELREQRLMLEQLSRQRRDQHDHAGENALDAPPTRFSSACACVNRDGRPQRWQTAPDDALPDDFAPGGTLRQVWSAEPATLMPMIGRDIYAEIVHQEVFEKLIWRDLDPPFRYVPGLAESWSVADDGRTVTFHLFPNARWSDGRAVTADDVVFTYSLVMNEDVAAPIARFALGENVQSCRAVDAHTVRFVLREPHFDAAGLCGNRLWILPEHVYGDYTPEQYNELGDVCVGSGPRLLERWRRGRDMVLMRNENYWGPKPALERMEIRFVASERHELELFLSGRVDVIGPTPKQWQRFIDSDELRAVGRGISYFTPLRGYTWIGYNTRLAKLGGARTRQALTMALDRTLMIEELLGGLGRRITGPFHPHAPQHNDDVQPLPYSIDAARQRLAEAGWTDRDGDGRIERDLDGNGVHESFTLEFLIPSSALGRQIQRYVHDQFAQLGIDVTLDEMEWSMYQQRVRAGDFEMIMQRSTGSPELDAYDYWHSSQIESGRNYVGYADKRVDALIDQARREPDTARRMELWRQVHSILHKAQPQSFLWTTPRLMFISHRIKGVQPHSLRLYTSQWYIPVEQPRFGAQ